MVRVAINGFGRIGRNTFKAGLTKKGLEFVAINDLTDTKTLAYLLKYDTAYGRYEKEIGYDEKHLIIDGKKIPVFGEKDPGALPWKDLNIDIVLECTGLFVTEESSMPHIRAGAKMVIISAPAKGGNVPTYLIGVNADKVQGVEKVISNASCTTNCIAPVVDIIRKHFGVKKTFMTTIHAMTSTQAIQDGPKKDPRKGRACFQNMIPTTTGAAIATMKVIPELEGIFDGLSIRVPILVGSLADFVILVERPTTVAEVNEVFKKAVQEVPYKGIVEVTEEPIVSSDCIRTECSAIVDLSFTKVLDGDFLKVLAWYDNEWAYSHRLAELALIAGKKLKK